MFEDTLVLSDMVPAGSRFEVERRYLRALLEPHQGKVSQAASGADMDRVYLYRLLRRHGIK